MTTALIIGAGFGGLALALRLQSAGIATTVVEARDRPGGRAYVWRREGFTFDAGPTVITDPDCLRELWELSGGSIERDVELLPVSPFYRLLWNDGSQFDYSNDEAALQAEIARFEPKDVAGYARFLAYSESVYRTGYVDLGAKPFLRMGDMARAAPALVRRRAWRSVYAAVSAHIANEKLRQAFSFHTLLVGGNPMRTSSIYALIHSLEKRGGVWFAKGGTNALVDAMVRHFERLGGKLILSDPVSHIASTGSVVTGVTTRSGRQFEADLVATNGDLVHSYGLIADSRYAAAKSRALRRKRFSPSLFVLHLGLRGSLPQVAHHSILFSDRYKPLLDDIYDRGRVPGDPSLYLHHPSATDASVAPADCSTLYALAPVPNLGKADPDWKTFGMSYRETVLDRIEQTLIPDLRKRIATIFHYSPADFATDLGAHLGNAFSLEPLLTQSAYFRAHNRDDHFSNLYFVGAGTHPGAGIPGVVASAKATASLILDRHRHRTSD